MENIRVRIALWLLTRDEPKRGLVSRENYITAMSKLYQNPAFLQYLDLREEYLTKQTMNQVVKDLLLDAKGITGQLLELRALRLRAKACYDYKRKVRDDVRHKTDAAT